MAARNTLESYGRVARWLHWGMALAIIAMFALGVWMADLDYYSPYYKSAPNLHRSIGIVLFLVLALRFTWRWLNVEPRALARSDFERFAARVVHLAFYPLLLCLTISGYLSSTLDGHAIEVFGVITLPALVEAKGWEKQAGEVHEILAWSTITLALLHAAAAIKHHVVDKSPVLVRMWSGATNRELH